MTKFNFMPKKRTASKTKKEKTEKAKKQLQPKLSSRTKKTKAKESIKDKTRKTKDKAGEKAVKPKYFAAVGRRKSATATVRLFTQGEKNIIVNEKLYNVYFPTKELQFIVSSPLEVIKSLGKFRIQAKVKGGGIHAQAEAVRGGIARALVILNPYFRKKLKKVGYLTRDARVRERKKFGLKRARKAPQWSKR